MPPTKPIIEIRYSRFGAPKVKLPPGLKAKIVLIDADAEETTVIRYRGVTVFRTLRMENRDEYELSDHWLATEPMIEHDNEQAFDVRDLTGPPAQLASKYFKLYPANSQLQNLAYAIDGGLLTSDGLVHK